MLDKIKRNKLSLALVALAVAVALMAIDRFGLTHRITELQNEIDHLNQIKDQPVVPSPHGDPEPPIVEPAAEAMVSGTINWNQDYELPAGATMQLELRDTTLIDASSRLIARQTETDWGQPPHQFELGYNPDDIREDNTYSVQVRVYGPKGHLLLVNDWAIDVITRGNPTSVQIDLRVAHPLADSWPVDPEQR